MSRVEDDRQEQRIAQQRQLQRQQDEAKAREQKTGESAFARKMAGTQTEQRVGQQKTADQKQGPMSAYESLMDNLQGTQADTKDSLGRTVLKQATSAFQEKLGQSKAGEGERMGESRLAGAEEQSTISSSRSEDAKQTEEASEGRTTDAKSREEKEAKAEGGALASRQGKLKTGTGAGGGQGGGEGDPNQGNPMGAGFRFNPALMAPVPVAQARDTSASERLRKVAQEIAQKIVENVRVGTNAAGKAEFQIDLRSNVLAGLSIKLSGGNGRISATFSGSDREVLKMLEENKEGLKKALGSRGLTLEDLKIEVRA